MASILNGQCHLLSKPFNSVWAVARLPLTQPTNLRPKRVTTNATPSTPLRTDVKARPAMIDVGVDVVEATAGAATRGELDRVGVANGLDEGDGVGGKGFVYCTSTSTQGRVREDG